MKAQNKKKTTKQKTSRLNSKKAPAVLVADGFLLRHLRLVEKHHTSKLIHHRHTSHISLVAILFLFGLFLFAGDYSTGAISSSSDVQISTVVPGVPPTVGAIITSPVSGVDIIDKTHVIVSGTCPTDTYVVVKNNNILAGTTNCTSEGLFSIHITIYLGVNVVTALNYDNYNQAGPLTASVVFESKKTESTEIVVIPNIPPIVVPTTPIVVPVLPNNPSVIPGKDANANCEKYDFGNLPKNDTPFVSVVCVPRLFNADVQQYMGILVWGGEAPYAVNIDLGDDYEPILRSFPTSGYYRVAFTYKYAGKYNIEVKLTDQKNQITTMQTAVQVNGVATPGTAIIDDVFYGSWFDTPVPMYVLAVAVTFGFWGGDIFNRSFGPSKRIHRVRKAT